MEFDLDELLNLTNMDEALLYTPGYENIMLNNSELFI